ncbi:MAG: glycosyltransferase family 4 protein [Flavobacteriales bacterium]
MKLKPKILLVGPASPHVVAHYERIRNCTGDVHLVSNSTLPPFELSQTTVVDFGLRNPLNWWRTPAQIRKVIATFRPDIVHVHQANAVAFHTVRANASQRIPMVLTVWGSDILVSPKKSIFLLAMVRYILRQVSSITAGSHHLAEKTRELLSNPEVKVHMCNFGVAANRTKAQKEDLIYTNRHHFPLYRVDEVIRTFAQFVQGFGRAHWKLIIAGDGPKTNELKALASALGVSDQCTFTGFLPPHENHKNYAKAKIYASFPESDSAAISLLEAMYHGCIPVVSNLPATNEWVTDSENGVVVRHNGDNPFERAMPLIQERIVVANRLRVVNEVSTEAAEKCFCSVIHETLVKSA